MKILMGTDSFTVTITDDDNHTEDQVINITVNADNDHATFGGTSGTGDEDGDAITGQLTATDTADGLGITKFLCCHDRWN